MAPTNDRTGKAPGADHPGNTPTPTNGAQAAKRAAIMEQFAALVLQVPEAEDDDGSGILARIMDSQNLTDLQDEGELPSSQKLIGRRIMLETIKRRRSDKGDGNGWYLVCDGYDTRSKAALTFSAGGQEALARISRAYVLGLFPIVVTFSEVQTKSGNTAINTHIEAASGTPRTVDA